MTDPQQARYRFGVFELDARTGELRKQGLRIRVNIQPIQVLVLLLERPGEVLTREEILRELWPDGTFVDYEHGLNSAVNRIREALGDSAKNPRFIETLARRGYRFVAPVERILDSRGADNPQPLDVVVDLNTTQSEATASEVRDEMFSRFLASPGELPKTSHRTVQTLFLLLQMMYLGFYVGALANLPEIQDLFSALSNQTWALVVLVLTAALLIPVRVFLLTAATFHAPGFQGKFLRIWPMLLGMDVLWSLSPLLLLHHINFGLALACIAPLVYSPFAQRSLILMGAGNADFAGVLPGNC